MVFKKGYLESWLVYLKKERAIRKKNPKQCGFGGKVIFRSFGGFRTWEPVANGSQVVIDGPGCVFDGDV